MMETQNQKIDHLAVQVASASFTKRSRTPDNFKQKGDRRLPRSASANSQKSNNGALSDGDEKMQIKDRQVRADNRQRAEASLDSGAKSSTVNYMAYKSARFQQPRGQGPRPPYQGQGPRPRYEGQRNQPWNQNKKNSNGRFPQTRFRPRLIERDGYHFYQCACTSWHIQNTLCPL